MPNTLDDTGLSIKTQSEIIADLTTDQRALVDPDLDVSAETPVGQLNGIFSAHLAELLELLAEIYDSQVPANAIKATLDGIAAISGTTRTYAAPTRVIATINVDGGFTAAADSMIASLSGSPTIKFRNASAISNGLGSPANIVTTFTAEVNGAQEVSTGQLSVISEPVTGWNSITNGSGSVAVGRDTEEDSELRARREANLAAGGDNTVDAIRTALLDTEIIDGVLEASVIENDTEAVDAFGIPSKAFEVVIRGGVDAEIAEVIFTRKPAGIRSFGSSSEDVIDSQGNTHAIGFTRPTTVPIACDVTLTYFAEDYAGDAAVRAAILAWYDEFNRQGLDVTQSRISSIAMGVAGVKAVSVVLLGLSYPGTASDVVIAHGQIALIDDELLITSTEATEI